MLRLRFLSVSCDCISSREIFARGHWELWISTRPKHDNLSGTSTTSGLESVNYKSFSRIFFWKYLRWPDDYHVDKAFFKNVRNEHSISALCTAKGTFAKHARFRGWFSRFATNELTARVWVFHRTSGRRGQTSSEKKRTHLIKNFLLLHVLDWDGWRDTKIKHNEKRERKLWKHQEQPAKESRFDEVRQRLKMVSLDYRRAPTSDRKRWMSPERELSRITWSRSHSEQNGSLDLSRSRFLESSCFRDKIFALWSSNKVESHARTVPSTCQFSCTLCTAIY